MSARRITRSMTTRGCKRPIQTAAVLPDVNSSKSPKRARTGSRSGGPGTRRARVIFAHGAGAPSSSVWMVKWAEKLRSIVIDGFPVKVETLDYPYMQQRIQTGKFRPPDRLPKLIDYHKSTVEKAINESTDDIFLIGKSMGSRVGCHVLHSLTPQQCERVKGVVCFGYPLIGAGKKKPVRDEVLRTMPREASRFLFIAGTRDPMCPIAQMRDVLADMDVPVKDLLVIETGDHSLEVRKAFSQDEADATMFDAISALITG